jgi:hypothetical protein
MRLDGRTRATDVLSAWAADRGLPFLGALRETQAYVRCIEQGLTLFDLPATQTEADRAQWQPILDWLEPVLHLAASRPDAEEARPVAASTTLPAAGTATVAAASPRPEPVRPVASARDPRPVSRPATPVETSNMHLDVIAAASRGPRSSIAARIAAALSGWVSAPRVRQRQA